MTTSYSNTFFDNWRTSWSYSRFPPLMMHSASADTNGVHQDLLDTSACSGQALQVGVDARVVRGGGPVGDAPQLVRLELQVLPQAELARQAVAADAHALQS